MAAIKHLVLLKFKEDAVVEDILKGMDQLVSELDAVMSFEWGKDTENPDMLRQGFTHAFLLTFNNKDDFNAFSVHPNHVEFSAKLSQAIENCVVLDFPVVVSKAAAP